MDEFATAKARAVLVRIGALRQERRTREAQALLSIADKGGISGVAFGRTSGFDTPAVLLGEHAALHRAHLLLLQDHPTQYDNALAILNASRDRLLGAGNRKPVLTGERRNRLLNRLAILYSRAGREEIAARLTVEALGAEARAAGRWESWNAATIEKIANALPDLRAADQLQDLSTRASRISMLHILGNTDPDRARATDLLRVAEDLAETSFARRRTEIGKLMGRRVLLNVSLQRACLAEGERLAQLDAVAHDVWELVADSHRIAGIGRSTLMGRHALFGQVLVERARTHNCPDAEQAAWLGRMALRPTAAVQELDAAYEIAPLLHYGDACALTGEFQRARWTWDKVLTRLRRARGALRTTAEAVEYRLEAGTPPLG